MQVLELEDVVLAGVRICLDANELHYDAAEMAKCASVDALARSV